MESRAMAKRKQATFASGGFDVYRRASRRARFLAEIDRIMPWEELMAIVEPYYPKTGQRGRPVTPLEWMIKLYFIQIWFGLSDPQTEDIIHDSYAVEKFLGLDLGRDRPPDETTILRFRHLIEEHKLGPKLLAVVNAHLEKAGVRVRTGTVVDATVIEAPRSTKNASGERDPEMGSTKKGNQWYFGAKLHVGVDSQTKVIHSVEMTAAHVHDSQVVGKLLHGKERRVYGDNADVGQEEAIRARTPAGPQLCGAAGGEEPSVVGRGGEEESEEGGDSQSSGACLWGDQAYLWLAEGAV